MLLAAFYQIALKSAPYRARPLRDPRRCAVFDRGCGDHVLAPLTPLMWVGTEPELGRGLRCERCQDRRPPKQAIQNPLKPLGRELLEEIRWELQRAHLLQLGDLAEHVFKGRPSEIALAKRNGVYRGRQRGTTKANPPRARALRVHSLTVPEIAKALDVSTRTVFRYLAGVDA
ncbi:MAG: hypothetical protein ACREOH_13910 [Candidatus Entotheonellia bacterium]